MVVGEVPEPLGSCKDQIEKSIVAFWVPAGMIDHPSPGITDEKTATALESGECRLTGPPARPRPSGRGPSGAYTRVSTLRGGSIPLLAIVDAIATLITVAVQQAPAILPARKLAFIVEARSFDGANRTVVIGDIRRKVIAVRECADHRVTLPRHSTVCCHHCDRGGGLSVLG